MRKIRFSWFALSAVLLTSVLACGNSGSNTEKKTTSPRPNILLVLMDDLGYADVGFMPGAAKDVHTPNIDELAKGGVIFSSAYVTHAFCGPSRTSLMTGRTPHQIGAQFNLAAFSKNGITTKEKFISSVLKDANYYTGVIGKWHLGEEDEFHPNNRGFDYFYGFLGGGHDYFSDTWLSHETYNPEVFPVADYKGNYHRPMMKNADYIPSEKGRYCTDVLTDASLEFFDTAAKDDKPFFLYMSYNAPHTPVQAMPNDIEEIKAKLGENAAEDKKRLKYTAMMYNVDKNMKRIVDKLKETGEYDNTMIVFLSDNGGKPVAGANNNPLRGRKGLALEGGIRVPMFIHWPKGKVPQGYTHASNFSTLDFFPTFAHLAGAKIPEGKVVEGKNVWSHIIEKTDPRPENEIVVMRHEKGHNYTGVVKNNYKLHTWGNGKWELYDLPNDMGEKNDIAKEHPAIVEDMKKAAYQWSQKLQKPAFFDGPNYGFEEMWENTNMPNFGLTYGDMYKAEDFKAEAVNEFRKENTVVATVYPTTVSSSFRLSFLKPVKNKVDAALYDKEGKLVQLQLDLKRISKKEFAMDIDKEVENGVYVLSAKSGTDSLKRHILIAR